MTNVIPPVVRRKASILAGLFGYFRSEPELDLTPFAELRPMPVEARECRTDHHRIIQIEDRVAKLEADVAALRGRWDDGK